MQALLRARDADVHEPSLLVDVARIDRLAMRQHALLQPDEEYVRKFETFRRVQRRQPHGVDTLAIAAFEHRDECNGLRQLEQIALVGLAFARKPVDEIAHTLY